MLDKWFGTIKLPELWSKLAKDKNAQLACIQKMIISFIMLETSMITIFGISRVIDIFGVLYVFYSWREVLQPSRLATFVE